MAAKTVGGAKNAGMAVEGCLWPRRVNGYA
jgi:hypothetical protein